jgi:hypothetical protein
MPVITAFWEKANKIPPSLSLSLSLLLSLSPKVFYFGDIKSEINEMKPKI